jgi:hypothetical protein
MTPAGPREIPLIWCEEYDVTWHEVDDETIRAGRAVKGSGEGPRWPGRAWWALAAAAVVVLMLLAGAPHAERGTLASSLLPVLITCAYILFVACAGLPDYAFAFKRSPAGPGGKVPEVEHPITVTISDEGYSTACASGSGGHAWTDFRRVRETDDFFLLLLKGGGSYYFPKRAVPAEDLGPIRGMLRRHLGEEARLMDRPASNPHPHLAARST